MPTILSSRKISADPTICFTNQQRSEIVVGDTVTAHRKGFGT
jgi:hypothetical protein